METTISPVSIKKQRCLTLDESELIKKMPEPLVSLYTQIKDPLEKKLS